MKMQLKPHEKFYITVEEACVYYNVGRDKMHILLSLFDDEKIVSTCGNKKLIARAKLDELLSDKEIAI